MQVQKGWTKLKCFRCWGWDEASKGAAQGAGFDDAKEGVSEANPFPPHMNFP